MKLLPIAALAATLLSGAENAKTGAIDPPSPTDTVGTVASDPDKLTPVQIAEWKAIEAKLTTPDPMLVAKKQAADAAKLAWYEAKEAYEKAIETANAEVSAQFAKLQSNAKCLGCQIDKKDLKWIRPPVPTTK